MLACKIALLGVNFQRYSITCFCHLPWWKDIVLLWSTQNHFERKRKKKKSIFWQSRPRLHVKVNPISLPGQKRGTGRSLIAPLFCTSNHLVALTGPSLCSAPTNQMHTRPGLHSRCLLVIMVFSYDHLFPCVHGMENTNHCRPASSEPNSIPLI